jgi:cyanate permease
MPIPQVQLIYGIVAMVSAVLFVLLAREKPATPPCPAGQEVRALMLDGLKHAFGVKAFWLYLVFIFIGLGLFNGITTWVENIIRPRGFSPTDAGTLGAMLLVGGVLGAVIIPPFSDRQKKRVKFLFLGIILSIPGLVGLTFARELWLLLVSAFTLGFFLISTSPIGMQYAAEITYPTPEGTSNGILQLFGQISVVFVYIMEAMKTRDGSFTPSLLLSIGLLLLCLLIITRLKDPGEIVPTTQTKSQDPHVQVP